MNSAGQPFAHAALVAELAALNMSHQNADPCGQALVEKGLEGIARFGPVMGLNSGIGDGYRALETVRCADGEFFHAREPVIGRVARSGEGIGAGQVRMGRELPGLLNDFGGFGCLSLGGQYTAGNIGGGNQIGGQPVGFEREIQGFVHIAVLALAGLGGEQDGPPPVGEFFVDMAVLLCNRQCFQGLAPIAHAALQIKQCGGRPFEGGVEAKRAFGKLAGGFEFVLLLGFEEQTAQAEEFGFR